MEYDYKSKKVVAVLSSDLEVGIALNVVGHLAISLGSFTNKEDLMGRNILMDASNVEHLGISRYPFIITKLKSSKLRKLINLVKEEYKEKVFIVDYPEEMLETGHDDELMLSLLKKEEKDIKYFGAILYGEATLLNELTGKFSLWK